MRRTVALVVVSLLASTSAALAVAPGFAPGKTTRMSVANDGTPANGPVQTPILSRDGRYAVFASSAGDLAGVTGIVEVYRHDRVTGVTDLVSVNLSGVATSAGAASPSVSADGRYVAFSSPAADLVANDGNGATDVFVRDMTAGVTVAATTRSDGTLTTGGNVAGFAGARVISDDGRFVAFSSAATDLVPEPSGGHVQAYVKDLSTGAVVRASVDDTGNAGNGNSGQATISGDGTVVAFQSASTNLSPLAASGAAQIYVRDLRNGGSTTLASVDGNGNPATFSTASAPGLSFDGRYLVFETQAQLDTADLDGSWDVYLRDRVSATTVLASRSANTAFGVDSHGPAISSDGAYVAFHSLDGTIVTGDANGVNDVFLYGRDTGQLTLVSLNDDGVQANGPSSFPSLSADGTKVLFLSTASNLVASPATTTNQVYLRDLATDAAPVVLPGSDATVAEGVTFTRAASFTDADGSTSWTATVDWGDGSGAHALAIEPDHTFTLTDLLVPGAYTVTVAVTDGEGLTGYGSFVLTVTNVAPVVDAGPDAQLAFGTALSASGSFTDPGVSEHYAATVDYGDGTGVHTLALAADRTFALANAYASAGTYVVTVSVSDDNGGAGADTLTVSVLGDTYAWLSPTPTSVNLGRTLPVHFAVSDATGAFVLDRSVRVELVNAGGVTVKGPYLWSTSPSAGVSANDSSYSVSIDTTGLVPGTYAVRVSFASSTLTGSFTRSLVVTDSNATPNHTLN